MNAKSAREKFPSGLVPLHLDYGATPQFVYLTLSSLNHLSDEPSVQQYTRAEPEAHQAILALTRRVAEAGRRVRELDPRASILDEALHYFTPEEIWLVDLAVDVAAMFAYGGGARTDTHGTVLRYLRSVDKHVHTRHWRKQVQKAGAGPAEFHDLRAHIPHHEPHP